MEQHESIVATVVTARAEALRGESPIQRAGRLAVWSILIGTLAILGLGLLAPWSATLDVLSHAKGHLLGLAAAAGLALVIGYRPLLVTTLGLFLTLSLHALFGLWSEGSLTRSAHAAASDGTRWRIISLNTWHSNRSHGALVEFIDGSRADVVLLYEFGPDKIPLLHELERNYPHRAGCAEAWQCSVVILSRHPFAEWGTADRERDGGPPRAWVRFGDGPSSMTIMAAHLMRPIDGPSQHWFELDRLAGAVQEMPGRVVVAGDFNDTPWSAGFGRFLARSGLRHMDRFIPTFPSGRRGLPQLAIDHVFASPGVSIGEVILGPDVGSDHRPLVATIETPSPIEIE